MLDLTDGFPRSRDCWDWIFFHTTITLKVPTGIEGLREIELACGDVLNLQSRNFGNRRHSFFGLNEGNHYWWGTNRTMKRLVARCFPESLEKVFRYICHICLIPVIVCLPFMTAQMHILIFIGISLRRTCLDIMNWWRLSSQEGRDSLFSNRLKRIRLFDGMCCARLIFW